MRTFAQKQNQPQQKSLANLTRSNALLSATSREAHPLLHLQHPIRNQAVLRLLQAARSDAVEAGSKLPLNTAGESYEQEADHISEQVMHTSDLKVQSACACGGECPNCQRVQPSEKQQRVQTRQVGQSDLGQTAVLPIIDEVLASPGEPLDSATRAFMELRFGHDFSRVRVHSGAAAERSALDVNASAYTVGQNIVFGTGRFAPGTHEGRRLIAHELTHVVQQQDQQAPAGIQRKEVNASIMDTARKPLSPQDWYSLHREDWEHASATGTEQGLGPNNSFMRAAWYNTINLRPGEYNTVTERHDYYDLISYVLEHDLGTPQAARGVRFFHATTAVTGSPGIGSVDKPIVRIPDSVPFIDPHLGPDTRQILREVNAELFALNMGVIRNLLSTWKEPRDPQTPGSRINAFDFDIRMVETEQGVVENFIMQNKARFTSSVVQDINKTMDPSATGQSFNFSQRSFEWAIKALGVPKLDFTIRDHRQAIGFASVHIFHRKGEQDYLAFMKQRVPSANVRPPNQYIVGNLNGVTLNNDLPGPLLTYELAIGTLVEIIDWSHMMGPYQLGDIYAGKVEVRVLDGTYKGKIGWTDFINLG